MLTNVTVTNILLVDDEPNVTEALKRSLRREPYNILTATSGNQAMDLMNSNRVEVVISDEQMPGMSGSQLLSRVRECWPKTIRMILSGQATLEAAVRAINEGEVYRFFLKPCNPTDLTFTIRQALAHKRLEAQSRRLLREYQLKSALLNKLGSSHQELLRLDIDAHGAIVVDESDAECEVADLLEEIERAISD